MDKVVEKVCGSCKRVFKEEPDFLNSTSQWRVCSSGNLWFNCNCGSTLMLPRGKFSWYSPDLSMGSEASSIFNLISRKNELPHIPAAVMELQQLLANSEIDTSKLVKAVRKDPFIAAEIMRACENMRRVGDDGASKKDPSLDYAITFIGRKQLASLVMVASMKKFSFVTEYFDPDRFWEDAFKTAAIAEYLWKKFYGETDKDKAYLGGCLANIGKVVAAIAFPEKMDSVWKDVNSPKTQDTWIIIEKKHEMPEHTLLGEIGAAFWGFPTYVVEAIKEHHSTKNNPNLKNPKLCHVISLANMVTHWVNLEPHRFNEEAFESELAFHKVSKEEIEKIAEDVGKAMS